VKNDLWLRTVIGYHSAGVPLAIKNAGRQRSNGAGKNLDNGNALSGYPGSQGRYAQMEKGAAPMNNPITIIMKCSGCGLRYQVEFGSLDEIKKLYQKGFPCPLCWAKHPANSCDTPENRRDTTVEKIKDINLPELKCWCCCDQAAALYSVPMEPKAYAGLQWAAHVPLCDECAQININPECVIKGGCWHDD